MISLRWVGLVSVVKATHNVHLPCGLAVYWYVLGMYVYSILLDHQFTLKMMKATNALMMISNGGGIKITEKCKIPGYKYPIWYSKKAITDIICLKNLIKCYRVTYNSKLDTTFVVHYSAFGLPDLLFEIHPCSLHVCYPKKIGQFGSVQTVHDNMKLFSKH